MEKLFCQFYETHVALISRRLIKLERYQAETERKLGRLFNRRLIAAGITAVIGLIVASGPQHRNWGIPFLIGLSLFIYLVIYSKNLQKWNRQLSQWREHYKRVLMRIKGEPTAYESGDELKPQSESDSSLTSGAGSLKSGEFQYPLQENESILSRDLHILGESSLFALIDESFSSGGKKRLFDMLLHPLGKKEEILSRQQQLVLLAKKAWPLTRFFLQGQSRNLPPDSCRLKEELKRSFVSPLFYKHLLLHSIFWPLGLGLFVLWALGFSPISGPLVFGIYCLYSVLSLGSATKGFAQAEALSLDLETLIPVFQWLEKNSDLCKELAPQSWKLKPTQELKRAHKILVCLSIQAHPLVFLIINAFFPWTYLWTWELEKWRENHYAKFSSSLDEIENLEAIGSMALFHYYQSPSFPGLSDDIGLKVKKVFHPLISRTKAVANDFTMTSPTQLTLITGSNMSGKSTFLRTLGINQHLAMIGCPVFAESFQTFVGPVLTCLQIKDSLQEGYSSFYYEVKRVKLILDLASEGKSFLYLIDEIFRGTNNRERLLGSQAVIRELLRSNQALGLISTHDLELTQLENEFPALHNGHFRDEVREDQPGLHFSYRYQQGPCPTTNALKIMAAEGLPVPLQFA